MSEATFTAAQIAAALHRSKRSVLECLKRVPCSETKIVSGNEARTWSKEALPHSILAPLEEIAARRRVSVEALPASPPPFWRPRYPVSQLADEAVERASLLQRALAPALARPDDNSLTSAELERLGIEEYRKTFGHIISTRHWRRLFRRTLDRDGGAENWGRFEIYLDESPARRPELKRGVHVVPAMFRPLQELISSFANPAIPTDLEKDCVWIYAFEHYEQESQRSRAVTSGEVFQAIVRGYLVTQANQMSIRKLKSRGVISLAASSSQARDAHSFFGVLRVSWHCLCLCCVP